jgi:hypothetical protein
MIGRGFRTTVERCCRWIAETGELHLDASAAILRLGLGPEGKMNVLIISVAGCAAILLMSPSARAGGSSQRNVASTPVLHAANRYRAGAVE